LLDLPLGLTFTNQAEAADLKVEISDSAEVSRWIYALVAPFPEIRDGVATAELLASWRGDVGGVFPGSPLLMSPQTSQALARFWGTPASESIQLLPADELLDYAWAHRPSWAIIPFEELNPRWKVLQVDEQSPIHKDFDAAVYSLDVPISLNGSADALQQLETLAGSSAVLAPSNRDPDKMATLVMTGVTALVRATAWSMEQQGMTYPARDIGHWLRQADITHISNEVPFAENCPFPNPVQEGVVFCSDPRYIALLEDVGTDVVELTGDHFHDWGAEAMLYTLALYDEKKWATYGGGASYELGRQPVFLTHNDNRLAFIGCNGKGGSFARAGATTPGSVACDFAWMHGQIADLADQGYLVIVTFQHAEHYGYSVPVSMRQDFQGMADAGAVIVSGSQAHHPHGLEFRENGLIHYGLGNLFFDQYAVSAGTRQGFVDRHIFYDGRHISTELLTLVFEDYARARPMNDGERAVLLQTVFAASGW
jgi:poly-gamma-glutamate synthesis protein (capsule biosynthesis protein)